MTNPNRPPRKIIIGADVYARGFHFKDGRPSAVRQVGVVKAIKGHMADVLMTDGKVYAISVQRLSLREKK